MAKRTEEKPFRPLEASLVQEVMSGNAAPALQPTPPPQPEKTIELRRPAEVRPEPQPQPVVDSGQGRPAPVAAPVYRQEVPRAAPPPAPRREPRPQPSQFTERMEREKRVLLTPSEDRALERVVSNLGAELGTSLKLSHVLRSCIRILINAEDELIERAQANGRTIRPPNGDLPAIEAFEKVVAGVLQAGIRGARPIR